MQHYLISVYMQETSSKEFHPGTPPFSRDNVLAAISGLVSQTLGFVTCPNTAPYNFNTSTLGESDSYISQLRALGSYTNFSVLLSMGGSVEVWRCRFFESL